MNRRGFIKCLGAFAAASALPAQFADAKVARAPAWAKNVLRFECAPLKAGTYTFSGYVFSTIRNVQVFSRALSNAEIQELTSGNNWNGFYVAGVKAEGGETVFEVPIDDDKHMIVDSRLIKGGIVGSIERGGKVNISELTLERGDSCQPLEFLERKEKP